MSDVRSLLASERASRRISHPDLSYTKSGVLNCLVCDLLIKSEALWEGHQKSANHKKNAKAKIAGALKPETSSKKRKIDFEDEEAVQDAQDDARKKTKPTSAVLATRSGSSRSLHEEVQQTRVPVPASELQEPWQGEGHVPKSATDPAASVNEDEWASFEREVLPMTQIPEQNLAPPMTYDAATISAAPVSAAELASRNEADGTTRRENEAEAEKEEEEQRMVEEFDIQEDLEERVRKLKEKREALRRASDAVTTAPPVLDTDINCTFHETITEESEDSDEFDDWGFR